MKDETVELAPRKPAEIDPRLVTLNSNGFGWREYMVRMPKEIVLDDLKEPGIWRRVQSSGNSLRKHDRVYMVAFDESWSAESIVTDSDMKKAVLSKPRVTTFSARFDGLFEDEKYRVMWTGSGFAVERKADGHRMTQPVASAAVAERDLRQLYPVKV
ncbi:hypothetical protein [Aquibium oceanicum]|uniref:Uncharacterized protein n=1 Tax=Aquibium oceanicum TaxID=1670800 RepID=A0A1L3SXK0_9HYPH|nr:hypothetical protein [Aquibium oceanicum]APH74091.1 hypothetical protein BSQ44_24025 [Aquibium oceanicum]